jgi:hypothetical protein
MRATLKDLFANRGLASTGAEYRRPVEGGAFLTLNATLP